MNTSDFVQQALKNLRPENPNWYGWAKLDADGNKIPNDQRMCWEHAVVIEDGVTKPSKEEFDAEVARLTALEPINARIAELKALLNNSDYKVLPDYDKDSEAIKAQRQAWREEIRTLEAQS
jgi:hypothetical protein